MSRFGVGETAVVENTRNGHLYIVHVVAQHQSEPNVVYVQCPDYSMIDGHFNVRSRKARMDSDIVIHVGTEEMIERARLDTEERALQADAERLGRIRAQKAKRYAEMEEITDFLSTYGWDGLSDSAIESLVRFVRIQQAKNERSNPGGNS